jgi:hypothetical protein
MSKNWRFELNCSKKEDGIVSAEAKGDSRPGFSAVGFSSISGELDIADQEGGSSDTQTATMEKVAWATAKAPAGSLFMTGFMLWMSGAGVHIFSIMITGMALLNPLKAIAGTNETFKRFNVPGVRINLTPMKAAYVGIQLVALSMGIWKINKMGLLPLTSADWANSMLALLKYDESSYHSSHSTQTMGE